MMTAAKPATTTPLHARPALCWLFGIVVDAAALVALQVILSPESRAAAKAARKPVHGAADHATVNASPAPSAAPAEAPGSTPEPRQPDRQAKRQPSATDRAKANAKAKRLMDANPSIPLAEVAAKSGVSERTASRLRNEPAKRSLSAVQ